MPDPSAATPAEQAAFESECLTTIAGRLRQGLPATIGVGAALTPASWLTYPDLARWVVAPPVAASLILAAGALASGLPIVRRHTIATCVALSWSVALLTSIAASRTDGFHSPYYIVLFLVWIFALAFLAISPAQLLWIALPHPFLAYAVFVALRADPHLDAVSVVLTAGGLIYAWIGVQVRYRAALESFLAHARLAQAQSSLATLNSELESRVTAQVGEIVRRAADVEALNEQLRARVAERSRELARALQRIGDGATPSSLRPGAMLGDRVVLGAQLGEGGMGSVFAAEDRLTGRQVAVKVMGRGAMDASQLRRFLSEAEAAATIADASIVKTLHVDVDPEGRPFLIQELVDGTTLADFVRARPRQPPAVVARVGAGIAHALAAAHAAGVVHRDVKPSNVVLCRSEPGVRVLDFGISKITTRGEAPLTRVGAVMGTPAYMAPEQAREPATAGPASDTYSLGVVLFELSTGALPFTADGAVAMLMSHAIDFPRDPRILAPDVPAALAAVILQCLEKDPARRPASHELARDLRALADQLGAPAAATLSAPTARA